MENNAEYSLYANGKTMVANNCSFDKATYGTVSLVNSPENPFINYISFIKTAFCDAEIPINLNKKKTCIMSCVCKRKNSINILIILTIATISFQS